MRSKVLAAELAAAAGIPTVIAGGQGKAVLEPILAGEPRGTRFAAAVRNEPAYKLWLRFGKPVRGRIAVDAGARRALVEDGASLLGVGVVAVARAQRIRRGDASSSSAPTGSPSRGNRLGSGARRPRSAAWRPCIANRLVVL